MGVCIQQSDAISMEVVDLAGTEWFGQMKELSECLYVFCIASMYRYIDSPGASPAVVY